MYIKFCHDLFWPYCSKPVFTENLPVCGSSQIYLYLCIDTHKPMVFAAINVRHDAINYSIFIWSINGCSFLFIDKDQKNSQKLVETCCETSSKAELLKCFRRCKCLVTCLQCPWSFWSFSFLPIFTCLSNAHIALKSAEWHRYIIREKERRWIQLWMLIYWAVTPVKRKQLTGGGAVLCHCRCVDVFWHCITAALTDLQHWSQTCSGETTVECWSQISDEQGNVQTLFWT